MSLYDLLAGVAGPFVFAHSGQRVGNAGKAPASPADRTASTQITMDQSRFVYPDCVTSRTDNGIPIQATVVTEGVALRGNDKRIGKA